MQNKTATNNGQGKKRRVFGAADTLGMLTVIIEECRAAGLMVTTRNDEAAGSWLIEVKNAHQIKTDEGLRVDVRPPAQVEPVTTPEGKVNHDS